LSVKTKQQLAKAGEFKIAGAYEYVSKYLSPAIETLKEMGGSGRNPEIIEGVVKKISANEKEAVLNRAELEKQINRVKRFLSPDYIYLKPAGVWNLTGKELWKKSTFFSDFSDLTKDKFAAKYVKNSEKVLNEELTNEELTWEIEVIKKIREIVLKNDLLKEGEIIHKIIKDIEEGVYQGEAVTDIRVEIFEELMDIESLPEKTKRQLEKAACLRRASGYKYFSSIIKSLQEFGGSGKTSEVIERVIEQISVKEKEAVLNQPELKKHIERAKRHLSLGGYIYSQPVGVWNLGKEWKTGIFSSEKYDETKDKFDAKYITDEELEKRIRQSDNVVKTTQVTTNVYVRNHYVTRFAKLKAEGICQLCEKPAPFEDNEGRPYLETHHIIWLSAGGDDSAENVVALCPNCHKKMHILNIESDIEKLKRKAADYLAA